MGAAPVRTTCPYCGVGCGVVVDANGAVTGDPQHPANRGRLCSKGSALGDVLGLGGRLLHPRIRGAAATWDDALDLVAERFTATIAEHGPGSVAFYVSGQLLTEDYYVANKLMKGFLGSGAIDTNSRLCMASSVAGHRRAFGEDVVSGCYEDFDAADLIVLVGSNTAWCHPVLYQRMNRAAAERGTRTVVIDPRRTATCAEATLHLPIAPGTDVLLFNGLLAHLWRAEACDRAYLAAHTEGFEAALVAAAADGPDIATVAERCGVDAELVRQFYELFAATPRTVTAFSQGVNQSSHGTDKVNAILNCHLATGRIGKVGAGAFSLTGQPNAMGGREVGGLANQLAAHMTFEDAAAVERVRRFWGAANMATAPGPKAVDMFNAVGDGRIKAIWIMATNPAVSLPDAGRVRAALERCPFVVVSDCMAETDTTALAHVVLPAAAWGEKDGTVTNSERRISRQRAFRAPAGAARPDWWIVTQVAQRMGFAEAFAYTGPAQIFREHAALTAFENRGHRLLDLGGLADLSDGDYDALTPVQWPVPAGTRNGTTRVLTSGQFPTPSGRARLVPVHHAAPAHPRSATRPFALLTGRNRDQWHTMAQTGQVARLARHAPEPAFDMHPDDAAPLGIAAGALAQLTSDWGSATARARLTPHQPRGTVFLPMHWSDAFAADCVSGRLANPATDAISGQPELKHTPVAVAPVAVAWEAFLLTTRLLRPVGVSYWARATVDGGYLYEMAGTGSVDALRGLLAQTPDAEVIEYSDAGRGVVRMATLVEQRLSECLFAAPPGLLPPRDWMLERFGDGEAPPERAAILAGRSLGARAATGRIVCSCLSVGLEAIVAALRSGAATDAAGLGRALGAGTNCGSCLPELRDLAAANRVTPEPAAA